MVTECPKCHTTLTFEFQDLETGAEVDCKHCDTRLKIKVVPEIIFDPSTAYPLEAPKDSKGTILLCIDGEATREVMRALLETLHYFVIDIPSGTSALTHMQRKPPALAFIDSGLSDTSGPALCQQIKHSPDLAQTIVILVGSMFEKNAKYRQEAPDWAGADDYIDRHEIQKNLLTKVEHHLSVKEEIEKEVLESADQETSKISPDKMPENKAPKVLSEHSSITTETEIDESSYLVKGARRLAKIIVSDIVIYNESKVEEGLKEGNFYELLESEILEGRQLYESRVDKSLYYAGIYEKALEIFIEEKTSNNVQDIPESEKPTAIFERPTAPKQETEAKQDLEVASETENRDTLTVSAPESPSLENIDDNTIVTEDLPEPTERDDTQKKDEAWQTSDAPKVESPKEVFQEIEEQAQETAQEPEPALEDDAWGSPETLETEAPQDAFQEMENQAQKIAQDPESNLEDNAWESPETLETEAPQDAFQEMENQAQEIAQEPEPNLEDSAWEPPATPENEAPQDIFQEKENQPQEVSQEQEALSAAPVEEPAEEIDSEETTNAKRLAKIIVSDIVIYNEKKVEKGLKNGTFYELLEDDIREGRVLFESRVSQTLFEAGLYENALEDFIDGRNATQDKNTLDSEKATQVFQKVEKLEPSPENNETVEESKEEKDAKRLANIIVSDIMIYNEKKVEKGLQNGTFYEILEDDIREGTALYESRVSSKILAEKDYLKEAFADFVSKKTASLS